MRLNSTKILFLFVAVCAFTHVYGQGTRTRIDSVFSVAERYVNTYETTNRNDGALFDYWRAYAGDYANKMKVGGKQLAHCGFAVYAIFYEAGYKIPIKEWGRAYNYTQCVPVTNIGKQAYALAIGKVKPTNVIIYAPLKGWFSGYHVGILREKFPTYATVYESNTSTKGSVYPVVKKYDGYYLKIRPYWIMWKAVDCLCNSVPSDLTKVKNLKTNYLQNFKPAKR
ncbi:hypothetical protein [Runella sp.]|uniref:hypothetical protein n=1 Tax=Runella sp. TaxID=1960881 RepID=UPI003D09F411